MGPKWRLWLRSGILYSGILYSGILYRGWTTPWRRWRRGEAATELGTRLTELGFEAADIETALAAFVNRCERKSRLESEESQLEQLRLRALELDERRAEECADGRAAPLPPVLGLWSR